MRKISRVYAEFIVSVDFFSPISFICINQVLSDLWLESTLIFKFQALFSIERSK